MVWAVTGVDVRQPFVERDLFAVGAGGHVAPDQGVDQVGAFRRELGRQVGFQAALAGFAEGAGVVGDEPDQALVRVLHTEVPGAVEWVEAGRDQLGGVADVVGCLDLVGVRAQ
ncbi:hypothetical protein C3Y87_20110 [Carbonactinospora thermoautotrophica]|uniref:hypothetical protein n=1 Tax=Carbonactinospora thermoautotrophica TaxID=1469144 RepID=UPI0027DEE320|nr:hypothetical protein [Carbonactinospora thermoautotrophica]MCX9193646.1 hypothetical protein [Carbonactinospora thermoautotrophica]